MSNGAGPIFVGVDVGASHTKVAILDSETEDHIIREARVALYRALIRLEIHELAKRT